ncbi:MAG: hypothetical protein V3T05_10820, partial [Myxococcota bacterium]
MALSACASQTRLAEPVRSAVAARHVGRTVELRQSCYYGELYDENEKWLLSPHAFADTSHIVDLDGVPIHPTGQRGVVAAGTRFIIRRGEFTDAQAMVMMDCADGRRAFYEGAKTNAVGLNGWGSEYIRAECRDATFVLTCGRIERFD